MFHTCQKLSARIGELSEFRFRDKLPIVPGSPKAAVRSLFRLSVDNVMIDAVKKAEDHNAIIVRVHEFTGARCSVELTSDAPIQWWKECDLMERPTGEHVENKVISFDIKPYEIRTFLVG